VRDAHLTSLQASPKEREIGRFARQVEQNSWEKEVRRVYYWFLLVLGNEECG
jgi:hypothetical protein